MWYATYYYGKSILRNYCLPFMTNICIFICMVLKKAQQPKHNKSKEGRCMMWRVTRQFHWALLLSRNVVGSGSLVSCDPGSNPLLWYTYATCGKIYPTVCHTWQIYINIHGAGEQNMVKTMKVKREESLGLYDCMTWVLLGGFMELYSSIS